MKKLFRALPVMLMALITGVATSLLFDNNHYIVGTLFFLFGTFLTAAGIADFIEENKGY